MNPALTGCKIFDKRNQFSDMTQVLPTHTNTRQNKPEKKYVSLLTQSFQLLISLMLRNCISVT